MAIGDGGHLKHRGKGKASRKVRRKRNTSYGRHNPKTIGRTTTRQQSQEGHCRKGYIWNGTECVIAFKFKECCEDNNSLVTPFDCAGAVAQFANYGGCDFEWGDITIGEACPLTCGLCDYDPAYCVETCYDCTQWGSDMTACLMSIGSVGDNPNGCTWSSVLTQCVCDPAFQQTATELPCCLPERGGRKVDAE